MASNDVQATLREMWSSRPRRRQSEAKVAGVAGAVARRYDVDPLLVRIGFVVAAFYGVGFVLYLAGWLALPADEHDRPRRAPHPVLVVGLVIAAVATTGSIIGGHSRALLGLAVAALLLFLLHRSRGGVSPADTVTPPANTPAWTANTPAGTANTPDGGAVGPADPPRWDPLGAAPFAWDLPEPGPSPAAPPPPRPRPRSRVTLVTLGLALLAGGVSGALLLAGGDLGDLRTVFGVVLGVLGLGLVVGAFRHGGRGLILPAVPLILLTYGLTAAPMGHLHGVGDATWTPATAAAVAPAYQLSVGDATLDLRRLGPAGPVPASTNPVRTRLELGTGDATVLVPPTADVTAHCHSGLGSVDCLGQQADGQHPDRQLVDLGRDGAGGAVIDLDVSVGLGDLEVRRG